MSRNGRERRNLVQDRLYLLYLIDLLLVVDRLMGSSASNPFSQNSGLVPNAFPRRNAVEGVTRS